MKRRITALMLILMMILSVAALTACGKKGEDPDADIEGTTEYEQDYIDSLTEIENDGPSDYDQPKYDSEEDGAEVVKKEHPAEDFYGSWKATSKRSAYMYGNVDITIKEDGTWNGNVTEEDFHGKWTYDNGAVVIKDSEDIIDFTLFYNDDGYLMFCNNEIPEDSYVLEKN